MRAYPLIRRKWSNEHIMTALFGVLILYLVPHWIKQPGEFPAFLAALALALILDSGTDFLLRRRQVCSVSAAVTAGVLQVITPGIPLWGRLVGVAAAILIGKTVWGGTGKNTLNPAILGYLAVYFLFGGKYAPIEPTGFLIPALLLSIPFITFRPFASIGLMSGMAIAMLADSPVVGLQTIIVNCIFFGCLIITDPVTTTPMKLPGFLGAFVIGFLPLQIVNPALNLALSILIFNLFSFLVGDFRKKPIRHWKYEGIEIRNEAGEIHYDQPAIDLTNVSKVVSDSGIEDKATAKDETNETELVTLYKKQLDQFTPEEILAKIAEKGVYGCGGAAFPTAEKIKTVISSKAEMKYLILNGVECDPGLVHDKWLLHNRKEQLSLGVEVLRKCTGISETILMVKDLNGLSYPETLRLRKVKNVYPSGYEKLLVEEALKRKLPEDAIPAKEGILVLNIQTLLMIYEAVLLNRQITEKYITVLERKSEGGTKGRKAVVARVKEGDLVFDILDRIFPGKQPIYTGGGAMQSIMADEFSVIGKETNFIAVSDMPRYKESPLCSKCAECTENCPQGIQAGRIAELVDAGNLGETAAYEPEKCIRCGICSYVCPAGKNLSARVAEAREEVRQKQVLSIRE